VSEEKDVWADLPVYPKLAQPPKCVHPERTNCNHSRYQNRCEFMKCRKMGDWFCSANPGLNSLGLGQNEVKP